MAEALDALDPPPETLSTVERESPVRSPEVQDEVRASCKSIPRPRKEGLLGPEAFPPVLDGPDWWRMLDMWEG